MSSALPANMPVPGKRQPPPELPGAQAFVPAEHTLAAMRACVATCRGCPRYRDAAHAAFGEGGNDR
jgi:hypothetical protein